MIEIMNEANTVYEDASHSYGVHNKKQAPNQPVASINREDDFVDIINPKYLGQQNMKLDALPTTVKYKMMAHNEACTCLAFNPSGDTLATGGDDKCVKIWNTKKMTETTTLRSKTHSICAVAFSPDNELLM